MFGLTKEDKDAIRESWFDRAVEALSTGDIFWIDAGLSRIGARFLLNEVRAYGGVGANLLELPPDWDLVIVPLPVNLDLVRALASHRAGLRSR